MNFLIVFLMLISLNTFAADRELASINSRKLTVSCKHYGERYYYGMCLERTRDGKTVVVRFESVSKLTDFELLQRFELLSRIKGNLEKK